ncbi:LOW QUALITY PROTEIN: polycystin-1 [Tachyglossus aculeatus]|uniref:LOW QUALITY PROTEIN: polycystin-1 n=1 Tax=Tachyglossus aculeatus TaxID=9261 RepID=UPI0018F27BCC|nr:LOW QUALITY PROTEIN: polycystin-1 [Tachyglossus aculeatus]
MPKSTGAAARGPPDPPDPWTPRTTGPPGPPAPRPPDPPTRSDAWGGVSHAGEPRPQPAMAAHRTPRHPAASALLLGLGLGLCLPPAAAASSSSSSSSGEASGPRCLPCGLGCRCSPGDGPSCQANCSARGLGGLRATAAAAGEASGPARLALPAHVTHLDLSDNQIRDLDPGLFENLSALTSLDLSNNAISTLEEGIFANLFNLSEINLGRNPLRCDCALSWLPGWVEEQGVRLLLPGETLCAQPPSLANLPLLNFSFSGSTCEEDFIACLPSNHSEQDTPANVSVVAFSAAHEGPLGREACAAFCCSVGQDYGALAKDGRCLCGAGRAPDASAGCLPFCAGAPGPPACGGPRLMADVFPARLEARLLGPRGPQPTQRALAFNVSCPLPAQSVRWDFGDGSAPRVTPGPAAAHLYALPGRYNVTAAASVGVGAAVAWLEVVLEAPPQNLSLSCPALVRTNESLDLTLWNRGGTGLTATYTITAELEGRSVAVHPLCPEDTEIFAGNGHCYRLVVDKASWPEADRHCRLWGGGALASVGSPEVQSFLVSQVIRSLDVWIGFKDVAAPGAQPAGEGFDLQSCQNWLPGEPHPATADHCVRMGPTGQCNTDLCMAAHSYVCEFRPQVSVLDAPSFLVGDPSWDLPAAADPLVQREALSPPARGTVEVMFFPELQVASRGFLSAVELGTQDLPYPVQLWVQVFRPRSRAGEMPTALAEPAQGNASQPGDPLLGNQTWAPLECPAGWEWCQPRNACQPLGGPRSPGLDANASSGPDVPPDLVLWKGARFSVPAGPSSRRTVTFWDSPSVNPGDLLGLQHDAAPGSFLLCPAPGAPVAAPAPDWLAGLPLGPPPGRPTPAPAACAVRALIATERPTALLGPNPGLPRPGSYTVTAAVAGGLGRRDLACGFRVAAPVSGLRILHPAPQQGRFYVPADRPSLLLGLDSGDDATARRPGANGTEPFRASCPPAWAASAPVECGREAAGGRFAVLPLTGLDEAGGAVDVVAENAVSRENVTVWVKAEEPVRGLRATPDPQSRVLQGILVRYSPVLEAGSDVTFKWTIDDKQSLTFYNVVFNVIYQSAAVFKLSLTASNHVSDVTVNYNVTVEKMNRMKDLSLSDPPPAVPLNATLDLSASVWVDSAVDATFLWTFGDGRRESRRFRPPYNETFPEPDPAVHRVLLEHNVTHAYRSPGDYNVTVFISNAFENLTRRAALSVRAPLTHVVLEPAGEALVAGRPVAFAARPLPSSAGALYTWDFGDGSPPLTGDGPTAEHTFARKGPYHVTVRVANGVSDGEAAGLYRAFEEIRGLRVSAPAAAEQGTLVAVNASLDSGSDEDVTWTFDLGDGTVQTGPEPRARHVYAQEANLTVTVTAANPAGSASRDLALRVFVLEVLRIEPAACVPRRPDVRLLARVTGDPAGYVFDWTVGDGSPNVTVRGSPELRRNFSRAGVFPLALVLSSRVNRAHYFTSVCVEPELANVSLRAERRVLRPGEEGRFRAGAAPPYPYRYAWDFGEAGAARPGGAEAGHAFRAPGVYSVTVTVSNNVSSANDTTFVEVQEPVELARVETNGSRALELGRAYAFWAVGNGSQASYLWDLGDGERREGRAVVHAYNRTGRFGVSVLGWNEVSRGRAGLNVTVQGPVRGLALNASRTVVPLNGSVGFGAALRAGSAVRYSWVLCDRCTAIPGAATISYTFRSVGTFNVTVTAENEVSGLQDSILVHVLEQIEGLRILGAGGGEEAGGPACFPTNRTLQLQAAVREGTNVTYGWTVLRGAAPVQAGPGRAFPLTVTEAGTYRVRLRASNLLGAAEAEAALDFVEGVRGPRLSARPNPAAVDATVNVSAAAEAGSGLTYTWHLGGGRTLTTREPWVACSFATPGLHRVAVSAGNRLGAANATVAVSVQEPVRGLRVEGPGGDGYVASGAAARLEGRLERGTDVAWRWELPGGGAAAGRTVTAVFPAAGPAAVRLNASNAVSWAVRDCLLTVQDAVRGLELEAERTLAEPGEAVRFRVRLAAGSAVDLRLRVDEGPAAPLAGPDFSWTAGGVGEHRLAVEAENRVSRARAQVSVSVLEPVGGLEILDCCEAAVATGSERNYSARVRAGTRPSFAWDFSLQKVQGDALVILTGQNISYTPVAAGTLTIHLRAFNELGGANLTRRLLVQDRLEGLGLRAEPAFARRAAAFEAAPRPSARQVTFAWDFGDGSPAWLGPGPHASHAYAAPGDFLVAVNASNLVSFVVAQLAVTVRALECEEPQVEVALPRHVALRRAQRNYLEAQVDLRGCVRYRTEYRWQVFRAPSCPRRGAAPPVPLPGVDVRRPRLVLPRLALAVGDYCFVLAVSFGDTPLSRTTRANVTVLPGRLVPLVDGGSYRVWSSARDLVLDGGRSYDPDLEDGDQTPLTFEWSCVASSKGRTGGCSLNTPLPQKSTVTVPARVLDAGEEYTFALTIHKPGRNPERTNQTVLIRRGPVPILSLQCVSCKAQSVYEVSKSSYVYLEGTCLNCPPGTVRGSWSAQTFSNRSLVLDESTTTTGSAGTRLVLRQGVLRDGEGYTFTLRLLGPSGQVEGLASIDLFPNRPPFGGSCRLSPLGPVTALTTRVHFECTGWRDLEDEEAPLVYSLLLRRCKPSSCEEFCAYKGSLSEYGALLPPGFKDDFTVHLSVVVQDQLGASVVALTRSLQISLPAPPAGFRRLSHWLHNLTETVLPGLVQQADPQHVIEYSLALVTVLNEYEQMPPPEREEEEEEPGETAEEAGLERRLRAQTRRMVTDTLVSLNVNTVDDIQQIAAALAQCTVASKEFVCRLCLKKTLQKLESMMAILQDVTTQGTVTPTTIADNILNITGDLIHLVNSPAAQELAPPEGWPQSRLPLVASEAYGLSSELMRIVMRSRVLNEEPLTLASEEIVARGKRADPSDPSSLLCYEDAADCQFSIPPAFDGTLADVADVVQVVFLVDSNPFPFGFIHNFTVSTRVASMRFQRPDGTRIPVRALGAERAITVKVANHTGAGARDISAGSAVVEARTSVSAVIATANRNREAALHFQLTYTVLDERYLAAEPEPFISVYLHSAPRPNEHNCSASKRIGLGALAGSDHKPYTFFVSPLTEDTTGSFHFNITSHFRWTAVEVTVGLHSSLCQYFSEQEMRWKTEGIVPLEDTTPTQAVCLTQHLTAFGASLFVPPSSVRFIFPEPAPGLNYVVLLTCAVCLAASAVAAGIVRRLDLLDISRVGVTPFCGRGGPHKYEIWVKTGWGRGSGTTAHVGITLYGVDGKSGHRHLDGEGAFRRNSLDVFQIATDRSLGGLWKIRVWHDNKGLSPAWFLQHVIVKDLQSGRCHFFLVNDWLSVEGEDGGGLVEKEVLAASEAALRRFPRLLVAELQRGFFEKHIWLSLWDRPPRSRFTRVQRATCCALLLTLFLCANAVWYGVVGDAAHGDVAVASLLPVSADTMAVGLVSSVVVYPLYLIVLFLFRMARSKVSVNLTSGPPDPQSPEPDNSLDSSVLESSFLTFSGLQPEAFSEQTKTDLFPPDDSRSLIRWQQSGREGVLSWPDLLSDPSIVGSTVQRLKRGRSGRPPGVESSGSPADDNLSLAAFHHAQTKYFSASDEDLVRRILAEGAGRTVHPQDGGQRARPETNPVTGLPCAPGDRTDALALQKVSEKGQPLSSLAAEDTGAEAGRTVPAEAPSPHLLPPWCAALALGLSLLLLAAAVGVSVWIGAGFSSSVGVMWLISDVFSFLASFLLWEPIKALLEALYLALVARRLHPEEGDTLVERPVVRPVSERIPKVRPPQGFALFQAREEARKVKQLHELLKNWLLYALLLLIILLANYGDAGRHGRAYLLQRSIKQELGSAGFLGIRRSDEFWAWMSRVLLPYVHGNPSTRELGALRLRQVRLRAAHCPDVARPGSFNTADYGVGWEPAAWNGTAPWGYSAPELAGVWYWGSVSVYDSGGYVQELGLGLERSRARLRFLQRHNWIDNMSRAVFVELTRYSPGVDLHAAVTLRLEFPVAGGAVAAVSVLPFPLEQLGGGVTLQLLTMMFLMLFVIYLAGAEALAVRQAGRAYFRRAGAWGRWLLIMLATAAALVHLSQVTLAERQWARFLRRRRRFTSFYQVAWLSSISGSLAACLLFLLTLQAAQQLRFVRQWAVFGKTVGRSLRELLAAGAALGVLAGAYAQLGFLLFSSCSEALRSLTSGLPAAWADPQGGGGPLPPLLATSLPALGLLRRLVGAALLHSYRQLRGELFRPAFEPQDHELVDLLLRRLRLWMGFSKVKEFRHKVRFEGMEPPPSRSSSQSKSSQGPPPSAGSDASRPSTASSQLEPGPPRDPPEPDPPRLLAVSEALLAQFDRVIWATEDVYRLESRLEGLRGRLRAGRPGPPAPPASAATLPGRIARARRAAASAGALLAAPKAYTPANPPRKKGARVLLQGRNRVHPSAHPRRVLLLPPSRERYNQQPALPLWLRPPLPGPGGAAASAFSVTPTRLRPHATVGDRDKANKPLDGY